ncbi:hypothetical protein ACFVYT_33875 [Streptomyces sp. NPDC058290]|uniref:hypothetical protein n=1 Tax=Streptomyces sp. NPDC058290 TaxID=3346426 RepID=UPI0036E7D17F
MLGLYARTFHAGVDHLAFRFADREGAAAATGFVDEAYGAFHVFSALNVAIMGGWFLLAAGAWRARVLGPLRAAALAATAALPLGVLKGTTPLSVVAAAGLCLASSRWASASCATARHRAAPDRPGRGRRHRHDRAGPGRLRPPVYGRIMALLRRPYGSHHHPLALDVAAALLLTAVYAGFASMGSSDAQPAYTGPVWRAGFRPAPSGCPSRCAAGCRSPPP